MVLFPVTSSDLVKYSVTWSIAWPHSWASCLYLHQFRLVRGIMFLTSPFVRSSITVNMILLKWINWFCCKLVQVVHGTKWWNDQFWGQGVKGQSYTTPKLDPGAWHCWSFGWLGFVVHRFLIMCQFWQWFSQFWKSSKSPRRSCVKQMIENN